MTQKQIIDYYSQQGEITSIERYKGNIPKSIDVSKACDLVNNLILIDFLVNMKIVEVPDYMMEDISVRNVEEKLDILMKRCNLNIAELRENDKKILGNCRDTSVMLCAVLRENGIPARVRSGFATFFSPKKKYDHWLCEYWDEEKSVWIKVDSWMYQIHYHKNILPPFYKSGLTKLSYNPLDVEDKYFIPGGQAWKNCNEHGDDSNKYGTYEKKLRGMWFIRDNMLRDLLCLNKIEPLPWDCKGLMSGERGRIANEDKETLNYVSNLLADVEGNFDKLRNFYHQNKSILLM